MKTYKELTAEQQQAAREKALNSLLKAICEGFPCVEDRLQKKIDKAIQRAENMQTPWFAHEYIMDSCGKELTEIANSEAEGNLYAEPGEYVVHGIAQ